MAFLTFEQKHDLGKDPLICPSKIYSAHNMAILTFEQTHHLGKALLFVHPKFTLLCMSILTLEQILISVLVLVLDMKVFDVLFKK